jgi:ABC-2 type transport system ATP-binding protein
MKQKLALACTLIHTPELLVLDEPTTGVDPVSRRDFWKILAHLQRDGLTLLATTPYLDEAERCQRIALMDHGRLLTVDAPAHLKQESAETIVEILARPKRQATDRLRELPEVADVQSFGERLHATLKGVDPTNAEAAASRISADLTAHGIEVESVRPVPPTLEDIFIARIEAAEPDAAAAMR